MKPFIGIIFFLSFISNIWGQTLIPDGGFEHVLCNSEYSYSMENSKYWFNASGFETCDIWHLCFENVNPIPYTGGKLVYPVAGKGMLGFIPYSKIGSNEHREVASIKLNSCLIKDSVYIITLYILNSQQNNDNYWNLNIGLLFSEDTISQSDVITDSENHISIPESNLYPSDDWNRVELYYRANGNENFLNIGTFGPSSLINYSYNDNFSIEKNDAPYYLIDEIKIMQVDKPIEVVIPNIFTPNDDKINDRLKINTTGIDELNITVINRWGDIVKSYDAKYVDWDGTNQDGNNCTDGVYFLTYSGTTILGDNIHGNSAVTIIR